MFDIHDFLLRARLDAVSLDAWIKAGWLAPQQAVPEHAFTELDLARACLIRDLREGMGVNDEGIAIVLDLLDQLHGFRHALHRVSSALQGLPAPLQQEILARLRGGHVAVVRHPGEGPLSGVD